MKASREAGSTSEVGPAGRPEAGIDPRAAAAAALLALVGVFGCASDGERPPPSVCSGVCGYVPDVSGGIPMGGGGGAGEGEGGSGNDSGAVTLSGDVLLLNDLGFVHGGAFLNERVDFRTDGANGVEVVGSADGSGTFAIPGVRQAPSLWVLGVPRGGLAVDALPTLEPMRTDRPNAQGVVGGQTFALVRESVIQNIFDLLAVPLLIDASRGQLVMRVIDSAGSGLAGVTVTAPSAEAVLYGASGGFSDIPTETDPTGLVVLANLPASPWPGSLAFVGFSGARDSGVQLRVVSGAVTLVPVKP